MLGYIQRKRRLAHGRPAGDNDQIPRLKARRFLIEVRKASGNSGYVAWIVLVVQCLDALDDLLQQRLDVDKALLSPCTGLGNFEHLGFGFIQKVSSRTTCGGICGIGNFRANLGKPPHDRPLAHNFRVSPDICRGRGVLGHYPDIGKSSNILQFSRYFERFGYSYHVCWFAMFNQLADMAINKPVILPVKIILGDDVGHLIPGMIVQQQSAQHRLLRFNGVRRHFIGFKQRVAAGCGEELSHGL